MLLSFFWYLYGNFLILYYTYYNMLISFEILQMVNQFTLYLDIVRSQEVIDKYQEFKKKQNNMPNFKKKILEKENLFHLRINDFPYYLEEYIQHHVLWMKPGYNFTPIQIHFYLSQHIDPTYNFTFFENCTRVKSIKEIPHVHVFLKLKNSDNETKK